MKDDTAEGLISNIQRCSATDGPGLRTTVFLQGCNLRCFWCHNPETISPVPQIMYNRSKCIFCGSCAAACPVGAATFKGGRFIIKKEKCESCLSCSGACPAAALTVSGRLTAAAEAVREIMKDAPFYGSEGGVTFSGGEPLIQPDFLFTLLKLCKTKKINTAVDTAGNVPWENFEKIINLTDIFLYDIKAVSPEIHKKGSGADNRLILGNLDRLSGTGKRIIIRVPVIPDFNEGDEISRIKKYVGDIKNVTDIELLPYHNLGQDKAERIVRLK
ncbi:MAG: glycyl-radical enzyme activating protein [Oscillospiraceae bacterium]|nr:glycyl-radical enzyme activating protein [Oscillospiraceae bacterium]